MKKLILSLGVLFISTGAIFAQDHNHGAHDGHAHAAPAAATSTSPAVQTEASNSLTVADMKFNEEMHDFGTIPEGPAADVEFTFKNMGDEPIIIQNVRPSCGCTTPSWTNDPVLPGESGTIKASYATQGRPNGFTKSITVTSNAGTKVLTIKGVVEQAPTSSVPKNNASMMKQ